MYQTSLSIATYFVVKAVLSIVKAISHKISGAPCSFISPGFDQETQSPSGICMGTFITCSNHPKCLQTVLDVS